VGSSGCRHRPSILPAGLVIVGKDGDTLAGQGCRQLVTPTLGTLRACGGDHAKVAEPKDVLLTFYKEHLFSGQHLRQVEEQVPSGLAPRPPGRRGLVWL
jgi:hypothetical protein